MATELFSLWGGLTGWRSQHGNDGYQVTATLDGVSVWYVANDIQTVERAFSQACRRTVLRRILPWLAPPLPELNLRRLHRTGY
jgi:hypothetical protein